MPLIFRDEQGTNLSAAQVDANFRYLLDIYDALVASPPTANGISNITVTGSQFTVWLEGGETFGPFTMPVAAFHWRDDWLPDVGYFVNDMVVNEGSIYLVLQNHTSDDTFDPEVLNSDEPIYHHIFGPLDQTFTTVENWANDTLLLGPTDAGKYFRCLAACNVRVSGLYSFVVNTEFHFYQASTSPITFNPEGGAIINPYDGYLKQSGGRGRVVTLKCVATDTWDIFGGLAVGEEEEYGGET